MPDRERFPLPGHIKDAVVNRAQLADALNSTPPTVDRMVKEGLPVKEGGSNGRPYQFQLSDCWDWIKAKEAEKLEVESEVAASVRQMRLELLGGDNDGASEMALNPKQRRELYDAEHAYNRLETLRGNLVARQEVEGMLNDIFDTVRKAVNGMPDRLSRDAGLSGRQAEQAVAVADDILADLHRILSEFADGENAVLEAAE
ncbi:MAG: DUF1441 family protein [Roseibium sp.]